MEKELLYQNMGEAVYYVRGGYIIDPFIFSPEYDIWSDLGIINGRGGRFSTGTDIAHKKGVYYMPLPEEEEETQTKSICICLLNECFEHFKIEDTIVLDGTEYLITHVYLKCAKWNIELSKNVREVIIDRRKEDLYNEKIEFGTSSNSRFEVDEANPYLCTENGSLYSRDKSVLYFLNTRQRDDIVVSEQVKKIDTGAIYNPDCRSINFKGAVNEIKEDAIEANRTKFLINNATSQIQIEVDDIKKLLDVFYNRVGNDVLFSKPNVHGCLLDNGNIELHETIISIDALQRRMKGLPASCCDYKNVYLLTSPIVKWTTNREDTDGNGIVLYIESCEIPFYPDTIEGTKIYYYIDGSRSECPITVYETYDEVKELLEKAVSTR